MLITILLIIGAFFLLSIGIIIGLSYKRLWNNIEILRGYNESTPPEIVTLNPRMHPKQPDSGSIIVTTKTPQQFEREDEERVERIAST